MTVLGLLFIKRDWAQGLSLTLICLCAEALVIDTFSERRARIFAATIGGGASATAEAKN